MKIVLLSSYLNHHQTALAQALWEKTSGNFTFIATREMGPERKQLGYAPPEGAEYFLEAFRNEELARRRIEEADVVLAGSAPEKLVRPRIRAGKLLLRYSERPLKRGIEPVKFVPRLIRWHWRNPAGKPIYMLCGSAYTAGDYAKFGLFRNRSYKWGYFPETKGYEDLDALFLEKEPTQILWCGRFLDWKRPDAGIRLAKRLKDAGYSFRLKLIGCGEMEGILRDMAENFGLNDYVHFPGPMPPEAVRAQMEKAGICLVTSGRREGWGAVVNEAMNSGCAVVAGHEIGAVPYLIRDGENGLVYKSEDDLFEKVRDLLERPGKQRKLGAAAYRTIAGHWNASVAAERLIMLSERILAGEISPDLFESGPCSRAEGIT